MVVRIVLLALGLLAGLACSAHRNRAEGTPAAPSGGTVCYPLFWNGIVVGITVDEDLVTLHGPGLFVEDLGHGGGRFYTDRDASVTMIAEIGPDSIIESLTVEEGFHPPDGSGEQARGAMTSSRLRAGEGFGKWGELHFGSTAAEICENLGGAECEVAKRRTDALFTFETDYGRTECLISPYAAFRVKAGRLVSVVLYDGE